MLENVGGAQECPLLFIRGTEDYIECLITRRDGSQIVPVVFDFLRELCGFSSRTLRLKLSFSRQRKALNRKGRKGATAKNHYPLHFSTALWLVISDSALIVTGSPVPTAYCRGSPTRLEL